MKSRKNGAIKRWVTRMVYGKTKPSKIELLLTLMFLVFFFLVIYVRAAFS